MVKSASFQHRFPVPWEHATTAQWCKYPSPDLKHVKDALVLQRYVDNDGILHTTRLMCIEQSLPAILKRFAGGLDNYYAIERSTVDPKTKIMVMKTRNLTFESVLVADEVCIYKASDDGEVTDYSWSVECTCKQKIPFVTERVEEALVDKAKGNSSAGLSKMENLVSEVSAKWLRNERPAFARWPTKLANAAFDSAPVSPQGAVLRRMYSSGTFVPEEEPRRFIFFGPRKPFGESSWNPFRNPTGSEESD